MPILDLSKAKKPYISVLCGIFGKINIKVFIFNIVAILFFVGSFAPTFADELTPTLGDDSAYTLTEVSSESKNTITKYEKTTVIKYYDKQTGLEVAESDRQDGVEYKEVEMSC